MMTLVYLATYNVSFLPLVKATSFNSLMATSTNTSSSTQKEREALIQSGWWGPYYKSGSNHCEWKGIECDTKGSVIGISLAFELTIPTSKLMLKNLNITAFPNLATLQLIGLGLRGSIPKEIGTLTKLVNLGLSTNELQGKLPKTHSNLGQLEMLDLFCNSLRGFYPF
ncbi:hypothetical protein S245_005783 [Arachis hypogaea]|uniref:Leucine-rich repeat-containing N-terminal plant-type domain-containing protein n=1 Tax=Arachis hypogaea TaxID=3818 RepID=A0A445E6L7_ARAHY|nr:hypothetical protein Ahy_A02g005394 [Arachis hypogaea]